MPLTEAAGVRLFCKRDDLYAWEQGSPLQGNKVRKLWPLLTRPDLVGRTVVSFGGPYSNHLIALSEAGRKFGFRTLFFVRGEAVSNPVLERARANGSQLRFVSRSAYRNKGAPGFGAKMGLPEGSLLVPEGGTTPEALPCAGAVFAETVDQLGRSPDYFCLSAGTGGTAAGIVRAAAGHAGRIEVYPALKGRWMEDEITRLLGGRRADHCTCVTAYHFGGYGKFPRAWLRPSVVGGIATRADIGVAGLPELEPVYTAKLFYGVLDRIAGGAYPRGSTVVVLHTGGIY